METNNNDTMSDELLNQCIEKANSVVRILFAIMNEEEDINAYNEKTTDEMNSIIRLVDARFPEKKVASYDPIYTMFGQIFRNGYNTFGVDFLNLLTRRTDEAPKLCLKGLNDVIENDEITISKLDTIISVLIKLITKASDEEREQFTKALESGEALSDIDFLDKYFKEVEEEAQNEINELITKQNEGE